MGDAERRDRRGDAVKLEGTKVLHAPREVVWKVINDPAELAQLMPGVES